MPGWTPPARLSCHRPQIPQRWVNSGRPPACSSCRDTYKLQASAERAVPSPLQAEEPNCGRGPSLTAPGTAFGQFAGWAEELTLLGSSGHYLCPDQPRTSAPARCTQGNLILSVLSPTAGAAASASSMSFPCLHPTLWTLLPVTSQVFPSLSCLVTRSSPATSPGLSCGQKMKGPGEQVPEAVGPAYSAPPPAWRAGVCCNTPNLGPLSSNIREQVAGLPNAQL